MTALNSAIFAGTVVHKRLQPKQHGFAYRVFALNLDVDEIDVIAASSRVFGRNRRALISFYDRDHGTGDGRLVGEHIRATLREAGLANATARITLVCYPRLLGYVFNPLSVYFCYDAGDRLRTVVYEVSNTFGERRCYIIPVTTSESGVVHQVCSKELYVSPFTHANGRYVFHVMPPTQRVVIGVAMRDADGPVLKTHFQGSRLPLTDANLRRMLWRHPLMTLKVVAAIHFEALRLWLKGVPPVKRFRSQSYAVSIVNTISERPLHVQ